MMRKQICVSVRRERKKKKGSRHIFIGENSLHKSLEKYSERFGIDIV